MTGVIDAAGIDLGQGAGFSVALIERAQVQVALAWEFAAAQDVDHHGLVQADERRCAAQAVSLTASAMQDWATWALLATRVPLPEVDAHARHGALPYWRELPAVARAVGRPHQFALSRADAGFLRELGAWHGALSYADPLARAWLRERLTRQGSIDGRQRETHALSAELASAAMARACLLFDWAADVTGLPTPTRATVPRGRPATTP